MPTSPQSTVHTNALPECRCPADCGGRPEIGKRLGPAYPTVDPTGLRPPATPYRPAAPRELVYDALNRRLGILMEDLGSTVFLRPERGGVEWQTDACWLQRPTAGRIA
ncbi:hypothetical protein [Kitasatospora sp. LaBMicrA B282]|uniref:hypothetical protein n=1 Tax=Kitasatospora sp. LaBMicrA B282 TaxID=3420949 RepID=UPI003D0F28A7